MADIAGWGQYNKVDPAFTTVPYSQLSATTKQILAQNGASSGMTAEQYYAARGGVNASGYYGDSWAATQNLTDKEYAATLAAAKAAGATGTALGSAINAATAKKRYDSAIAAGVDLKKAAADYNAAVSASNAANNQKEPLMTDAAGVVITNSYSGNLSSGTMLAGTNAVSSSPVTPTTPSLAKDVFKNTLALFFGEKEMAKTWADELYTTVSKYYKTGATVDEAFNLSLQDAYQRKAMPEFTNRFKGIFALQAMKQEGKAVTVPTIAEYFATQTKMGELLNSSGLGELANENFLGDVISKGVSATEFGNRIATIFDRIDLAPQEIKDTLSRYFPTLDRVQLAKALALGETGAKELQKNLATYEVLAAAENQGIGALGANAIAGGLTEERAASLAAAGETYQSALGKFKTVGQIVQPAAKLAGIYGTGPMTQEDIENIVFKQSARESEALQNLANLELSAFSGQAGTIGSRSFASQARGSGLI